MVDLGGVQKNTVIVVAGPTASGKSALAMNLALRYDGEVVNADSMQVYAGTSIISAAPTQEDKNLVPHHLYEIYHPSKKGTVVDWLHLAVDAIKDIWARNKVPVVVGGTGMYIDNLINGTTPIPEPSSEVRKQVKNITDVYAWLQENDKEAVKMLNPADSSRVRRAAEVFLQTGKSIADWYKEPMIKCLPEADFRVIKIIPTAEELDERCYKRFDKMIEAGAIEEVRYLNSLNLQEDLPAMKMLGVPELIAFVKGEKNLREAIDLAKLHTRQYAKRQRTWFRNKLKADIILDKCFKM